MNEVIKKENIKVEDMIYEISGVHVMLDVDNFLLKNKKIFQY